MFTYNISVFCSLKFVPYSKINHLSKNKSVLALFFLT